MSENIDLSIIIINFNTKRLILDCVSSIKKSISESGFTHEIIVIDNNSTDGSADLLNKKHPDVKIVRNQDNYGYGRANNQGISQARGRFILLLNSDILVLENSIIRLYGFAKRHSKSFCGGKLYNVNGTVQPSCGPFPNLWVVFIMLFLKGDKLHLTRYSPEHERMVDWVSGACIIAHRDTFVRAGKFDESIFMYMDEINLLYQARKKGIRTWFYPNARFIHIGAASSGDKSKPVINIFKGLQYYYKTHYGRYPAIILKFFLYIKSILGYIAGLLSFNAKLKNTYAEAFKTIAK